MHQIADLLREEIGNQAWRDTNNRLVKLVNDLISRKADLNLTIQEYIEVNTREMRQLQCESASQEDYHEIVELFEDHLMCGYALSVLSEMIRDKKEEESKVRKDEIQGDIDGDEIIQKLVARESFDKRD